jgi:predicted dehydrogenase
LSVKVAVIGVGYLGKHHARIYSSLDGVELVAVADADMDAAKDAAEVYGGRAVSDFREILGEVDALSIVTPTTTHHDVAMECLRAGKDLLIEKPITTTVKEADGLLEEADRLGRIIQVGHLERYNPAVIEMSRMIKSPGFIESERLAPFQPRGTDVDVTLDLMIHDIDIVLSLLEGREITDIRVMGLKVLTDKIDLAKAWIEFEGGAKALITASRIASVKQRSLKVHQKDSSLVVDYMNMTISRAFKQEGSIVTDTIEIKPHEPLREEIADFVACVRDRRRPLVSGAEGRRALKVALEITSMINKDKQILTR